MGVQSKMVSSVYEEMEIKEFFDMLEKDSAISQSKSLSDLAQNLPPVIPNYCIYR